MFRTLWQTLHGLAGCGVPKNVEQFRKIITESKKWESLKVLVLDEVLRPQPHSEGISGSNWAGNPLPCPWEPHNVPHVLHTVRPMHYALMDYLRNPSEVGCVVSTPPTMEPSCP